MASKRWLTFELSGDGHPTVRMHDRHAAEVRPAVGPPLEQGVRHHGLRCAWELFYRASSINFRFASFSSLVITPFSSNVFNSRSRALVVFGICGEPFEGAELPAFVPKSFDSTIAACIFDKASSIALRPAIPCSLSLSPVSALPVPTTRRLPTDFPTASLTCEVKSTVKLVGGQVKNPDPPDPVTIAGMKMKSILSPLVFDCVGTDVNFRALPNIFDRML